MDKKWKICFSAMFLIVILGCASCEEEEIQQLAEQVAQLNANVDEYQQATGEVIETLSGYGLIDEDVIVTTTKISKEIDRVQPQVAVIAEAIRAAEYSGGDDLITILEAIQAGNRVSGAFNPYALYVEAGLTGVIAILGLFAKKKANEAKASELKYKATKQGVNKTMKEMSVSDTGKEWEARLYENIGVVRRASGIV